jgi:hypothetical protein
VRSAEEYPKLTLLLQAFWAFRTLMQRLRRNFLPGLPRVVELMGKLRALLGRWDPILRGPLHALGALGLECTFQMLLLEFVREVQWDQVRHDGVGCLVGFLSGIVWGQELWV